METDPLASLLRDRLPRYAPPGGLEARIRADLKAARRTEPARRPPRPALWGLWGAVAAALALLVGYAGGVRRAETAEFGRELVSNQVRALQSGHVIDVVSSDRHTVKPWLASHLEFSPPVPDPAPETYPLLGGRLDRIGATSAAALVYQRNKHWVTVYVWPAQAAPLLREATIHGYSIQAWRSGDLDYAAISDVPAADLTQFAARFQTAN